MLSGSVGTENALTRVGELLEAENVEYAIVVVGGSAMNLLGFVDRVTRDVDVVAVGDPPDAEFPSLAEPPTHLPDALSRAIALVARDLDLESNWLNTGAALQWKQGLPPGLGTRVEWRKYGALKVGIVGRLDLVFFKLYAAADATGPTSVHYQDLVALSPTTEELQSAAVWIRTQDPSPEFHAIVDRVVEHAKKNT